jgi:hypothetical protein
MASGQAIAQTPWIATNELGPQANIVYDEARQRLVVPSTAGALWEWDGQHWALSAARLPNPPSRSLYDPNRQRCFFAVGNQLLEFDGHAAVDRGPMPVASGVHLVVDIHRSRLLLCQTVITSPGSPTLVAFFAWDGTSWLSLPSPGSNMNVVALGYDEARQRTVLQTITPGLPTIAQTFEWDGSTWSIQASDSRVYAPVVFDPFSQQLVTASLSHTWTGSQWQPTTPTAPVFGSVTIDRARQRLFLLGTRNASEQANLWAYAGGQWSSPAQVPHPAELTNDAQLVYDSQRDRAIVVSGQNQLIHREWDGTRWQSIATTGGPSPRTLHFMAFDAARSQTVLFGGFTPTGLLSDTWTWNGTQWTLAAQTGPQPRTGAGITYDSLRQRVVLVGGTSAGNTLRDHWEWDGVQWQLVGNLPPSMRPGALGYDPLRNVLVHVDQLGRTHELGAQGWTPILPGGSGIGNAGRSSLAWDSQRQRLQGVLHDGNQAVLHEWDGSNWLSRNHVLGALAWDSRRSNLLSYTPRSLQILGAFEAAATNFGNPCGGSRTTTSLSAFGRPRPGDAAFHLDLRADATLRPAMIGYALTTGNQPIGSGCTLLLQNAFGTTLWFTDQNGFWHHPQAMPAALALRGVSLLAQGAVLDPQSPGSVALTQGLELKLGD